MYIQQSFSILFYVRKSKMAEDGKAPLYARITIDGLKKEKAVKGVRIIPGHWDPENKVVLSDDPKSKSLNKKIGQMKTDLERHFDLAQAQSEIATPQLVMQTYESPLKADKSKEEKTRNLALSEGLDDLINRFLKFDGKYEKAHEDGKVPHPIRAELLATEKEKVYKEIKDFSKRANIIFDDKKWQKTMGLAIDEHLLHFMNMVIGNERTASTLEKMWGRKKRFFIFLQSRYNAIDLPLADIQFKFLDELLTYNVVEHKMIENSAMKYVQTFKEVFTRTVSLGWTQANIFDAYHCSYEETNRPWPTPGMLTEFMTTEFKAPVHNLIRDCYTAGCYSGFAYAELRSFSPNDIIIGIDGKKWASKDRQKTEVDETLPLLPVVLDLIDKYQAHPVCIKRGKCFPIPCNIVYNRGLKEIAAILGWKLKLDGHTSRYFFANEIAYNNGVQLKTIAKMLGQKSMATVWKYVKGNRTQVSESMKLVENKLFHADGTLKSMTMEGSQMAKVISLTVA
jgi:integrase